MIGVLTVAPWHNSIGDIASSDATVAYLVDAGFAARPVTTAEEGNPTHLVVGGGDLLGGTGKWKAIKRRFEVPGPHVLNAVGVDPANIDGVDWSFTADYRLVTVRDNEVTAALRDRLPSVHSVPCPATLIEPLPWDQLLALPRHQALRQLEPGGYVVIHRHPQLRRAARRVARDAGAPLVVVDAQAHAQHAWGRRGLIVAPTHSPRVVVTLVQHARMVISLSLHLCVFALGQQVPFAVSYRGGYQSEKIRRYLARAGIEDACSEDPRRLVLVADRIGTRVAAVGESERTLALAHLGNVAAALRDDDVADLNRTSPPPSSCHGES